MCTIEEEKIDEAWKVHPVVSTVFWRTVGAGLWDLEPDDLVFNAMTSQWLIVSDLQLHPVCWPYICNSREHWQLYNVLVLFATYWTLLLTCWTCWTWRTWTRWETPLAIIILFATCWTLLHAHSSLLAQRHQLLELLLAHLAIPVVVKLLENGFDLLFCHLLWNLDYWWCSTCKYVCSKAMDSPPSKQWNYQLAHYWCNQQVMVTLENSALVINPSLSLSNNLKAVSAELIPSISSETYLLYLSRPQFLQTSILIELSSPKLYQRSRCSLFW